MLFLTLGMISLCRLGTLIGQDFMNQALLQETSYLYLEETVVFGLPPMTPLPTYTPTPIPTITPTPLPPVRLAIPAIGVNAAIKETYPVLHQTWSGSEYIWEVPAFVVGHYHTSGRPTQGTNIVFIGHNNTEGSVFAHLSKLEPGDRIIIYDAEEAFPYSVQKKTIFPYVGQEKEANAKLKAYAAPTSQEQVTLISCWPYSTNAHRIVVIAAPFLRD
jgi:LPXTG-site transpeptidase (sortase) family protein